MLAAFISILILLLDVLWWIIILQVILSWLIMFNVLNTGSEGLRRFIQALDRIMSPLYRPIQRILPDFGGIDFSPFVLLILIQIVQMLLGGLRTEVAYSSL